MLLLLVLLAMVAGCSAGEDDDLTRPPRTAGSPSPRTAGVPTSVPVGAGEVSPSDAVWAQDNELHIASTVIDVSPLRIDSFVVVRGGVYLVDDGRLWFTDLSRARDTGLTGVTRLSVTRDDSVVRVELSAGSPPATAVAFAAGDGSSVPMTDAVPATVADRLGAPVRVSLSSGRAGRASSPPQAPEPARRGPGSYGLVGGDGGPLVAFDARTRQPVRVAQPLGTGFELVRWTGGSTFYGLALAQGKPLGIIGCDLDARTCTTYGRVRTGLPLVFESGN